MLDCFHSTVRNVSGQEKFFGFLPSHGKRLAAGEEYSVFGNLIDRVAGNKRRERVIQEVVDAENLVIVKTPLVHLYDETDDVTKGLALSGGTLGSVDPCWGAYSSSEAA